jgi:hypothetical protein
MIGQKRAVSSVSPAQQQPQSPTVQQSRELNMNEMMTAKFVVEALAEKHSLPVTVSVEGSAVKIAAKDNDVIKKYDGILGFLSSLRGLPYSLKYKELCIGQECGQQFVAVMEVKK